MPDLVFGVSTLIKLFEAFFLSIAVNAIDVVFSSYKHPDSSKNSDMLLTLRDYDANSNVNALSEVKSSLVLYPAVLTDSSVWTRMAVVSLFAILVWCCGYMILLFRLLFVHSRKAGLIMTEPVDAENVVNSSSEGI